MEDKELMEKMGKDLASQANDLIEAASVKQYKEVKALREDLESKLGKESEEMKAIQGQLDQIQTDMKTVVEYKADESKPIALQVKEGIMNKDFQDAKKSGKDYTFVIKADTITNSNSVTNTIPAPFIVPGISESPYRQPFLREIVTVFNTTSPTVYWYEETARTDGAAMTAEAGTYGQGDQSWTQYSQAVKKLTEYQKFSDEMDDDNDWLISRMNNKLMKDLSLLLDDQQLSGSGAGNNIEGILTSYDTAYAAPTGLALNVDSPTYFDIMLAAYTQVANAYFVPNYFITHPTNVAQLMSLKTSDAAYSMPPWAAAVNGRLTIMGLPVIANTGVTVNTFSVGDFTKINLAIRKDIEIRLWDQEASDAITGLQTITATARAAQFASSQDTAAIVTGGLTQANLDALTNA